MGIRDFFSERFGGERVGDAKICVDEGIGGRVTIIGDPEVTQELLLKFALGQPLDEAAPTPSLGKPPETLQIGGVARAIHTNRHGR